jgi:NAD(P)-dependent dehydrogenase (short-subunit alcohol dehydrogenase family)
MQGLGRWSASSEGDSDELRAFAVQQREEGTIHPSADDDYDTALSDAWGGPKRPRWHRAAMQQFPEQYREQHGRRALVTGGSGGIGFYVAKLLAAVGMVIVLPARPDLAHETIGAAAAIRAAVPGAVVEVPTVALDLASFASVHEFSAHLRDGGQPIDVLCLNAGRGGAAHDKAELTVDKNEAIMQAVPIARVCSTAQHASPAAARLRGYMYPRHPTPHLLCAGQPAVTRPAGSRAATQPEEERICPNRRPLKQRAQQRGSQPRRRPCGQATRCQPVAPIQPHQGWPLPAYASPQRAPRTGRRHRSRKRG